MAVSTLFVALMLAESSAATPPAAAPPAPRPEDKIVCRKILETGSLVKGERVCHTRAEWAKLADLGRRDAEDLSIAKNGAGGVITPY